MLRSIFFKSRPPLLFQEGKVLIAMGARSKLKGLEAAITA